MQGAWAVAVSLSMKALAEKTLVISRRNNLALLSINPKSSILMRQAENKRSAV